MCVYKYDLYHDCAHTSGVCVLSLKLSQLQRVRYFCAVRYAKVCADFFFLISLRWRMAEGRQAARCRDMRTHIDAEREIGERERVRFHVALQTSKHIYLHELQREPPARVLKWTSTVQHSYVVGDI